jgi:UDP-N-acetylmuramate dehydrogenase
MATPITKLLEGLAADVQFDAPLAALTWFGVGGCCDALVRPMDLPALQETLRRCRAAGVSARVLGSGANLLVDDSGVDGVVLRLDRGAFAAWTFDADGASGRVRAGGGADMTKLMHEAARLGWAGLEAMSGIPASVGGAVWMNAGGKFGAIGDVVESVTLVDGDGVARTVARDAIHFAYRHTELPRGIVAEACMQLRRDDASAVRDRVRDHMRYKQHSQPMAENSAGCMFRNPTLPSGERVSAGMLIDQAGWKGRREGSAHVSPTHANFICVDRGGRAADVRRLVEAIVAGVREAHGVMLQTEVAFWKRGDRAGAI